MKCLRLLTIATVLVAASAAAAAEPSRFAPAQLGVLKATAFVNEPSGTSYKSNQPLTLTHQPTGPTGTVMVRIFAIGAGEVAPSWWAEFDPCFVYASYLLPVRVNSNGTINLGTLTSGWLRAAKSGQMHAGHYLLVFERGTGDGESFLRLNKDTRDTYFKQGLVIEVTPDRVFTRAEIDAQADADTARSADTRSKSKRNDAAVRCYVTHSASAGQSSEIVASNDECGTGLLIP
jgi:hypothetical protein